MTYPPEPPLQQQPRWSPYPESMLDIPRDVSFFDPSTATGERLDAIADLVGVKRSERLVPRDLPAHDFVPDYYEARMFGSGAV